MGTAQKFSPPLPDFHFSPNSEAISVDGLQSNQEPVVAVQETALVQQEPYCTVVICDHNVYGTIVIDVAKCRTVAKAGPAIALISRNFFPWPSL